MTKKNITSLTKTKAKKEYRWLLEQQESTIDKYSKIISRATGQTKEEVGAEIQAIYLDNLRKADDPVAMMKENLVTLMLKKQTSDYLKERMANEALKEAEEMGDEEQIKKIEGDMINNLMISDFDLKFHKVIQDTIKEVSKSEPRTPHPKGVIDDDKVFFTVEEKK